MKIGLQVPRFDWPGSPENIGPKLAEIARAADEAWFSSLWLMDHFFQVEQGYGPAEAPMLEGYSALSYLAKVTSRVRLGLMVTCSSYRPPGMLVKTVTTLDILSGGRACLGIGSGWYVREARGLGVPFPASKTERLGRLEETLRIAKHMWSGDRSPFIGRYYRLEEPINSPQPLSKPHPPILIGGEGERRTIRLVAEYGDACNLHLGAHPKLKGYVPWFNEYYRDRVPRLTRKLSVLREHCRKVGRPYDEIEPTVLAPVEIAPEAMSPDDVIELCRELSDIGVRQVIFNMPNVHEIKPIEIIGEEVIPYISDMI